MIQRVNFARWTSLEVAPSKILGLTRVLKFKRLHILLEASLSAYLIINHYNGCREQALVRDVLWLDFKFSLRFCDLTHSTHCAALAKGDRTYLLFDGRAFSFLVRTILGTLQVL